MISRKTIISFFCILLTTLLVTAFKLNNSSETDQKTVKGKSFAIVELFTSEGCSSCPPADQLLGDIVKKARADDKRIFALAFHVDYWNDLGWKDIYSSATFSHRQRNYAHALRSSVYTPQMVVNGKYQFVGSNSSKAQNIIRQALDKAAPVTVSLNAVNTTANTANFDYSIKGKYKGLLLNLAVVERSVVRHIKRGENTGLTMHHENVVRAFNSRRLKQAQGKASLKLPNDINIDKASLIAYVQHSESKEIVGAVGRDL